MASTRRDRLLYTETVIRLNTQHLMKRPLALWQKLLVALVSVAFLPACSSIASVWRKTGASLPADEIIFSHAEPQTPIQPTANPRSNAWSPTQWTQVSNPPLAQPPIQAVQAPVAATAAEPLALTVYFDNDRDTLTPTELERLKAFASNLDPRQTGRLEVTGHTDSHQTAAYNQELSKRRAETVRQTLLQWGIPEGQVVLGWHGLHLPAASNATEEGRAKNRRVEVKRIPGG